MVNVVVVRHKAMEVMALSQSVSQSVSVGE